MNFLQKKVFLFISALLCLDPKRAREFFSLKKDVNRVSLCLVYGTVMWRLQVKAACHKLPSNEAVSMLFFNGFKCYAPLSQATRKQPQLPVSACMPSFPTGIYWARSNSNLAV